MRRVFFCATILALLGLFFQANFISAQQVKKALATNGWGSLSGKVTLKGAIPPVVDLTPKMKDNKDSACCLAGKSEQKIDRTWIIDPKTKAIANVVVWLKAPPGTFFPIHPKLQQRKDDVLIDQPHCAYLPRVSASNPVFFNGVMDVKTGQRVIVRNSAIVPHNVLGIVDESKNTGFNHQMPPNSERELQLNPQRLPVLLQCNIHGWMAAKLFVFDHPYYTITKTDGTFEMPIVPAGAEISVMAWHEGVGWLLTSKGKQMKLEAGKNTLDFAVTAP